MQYTFVVYPMLSKDIVISTTTIEDADDDEVLFEIHS
jgi:hypothetical protein